MTADNSHYVKPSPNAEYDIGSGDSTSDVASPIEHSSCQACSMARLVGRPGCVTHYRPNAEMVARCRCEAGECDQLPNCRHNADSVSPKAEKTAQDKTTRQINEAFIDGYLSAMDAHGWGGDRWRADAERAWTQENTTDMRLPQIDGSGIQIDRSGTSPSGTLAP